MDKGKWVYYILLFSGAILFISGIYRFASQPFWDANPFYYRLVTLLIVIVGASLLLLANWKHEGGTD